MIICNSNRCCKIKYNLHKDVNKSKRYDDSDHAAGLTGRFVDRIFNYSCEGGREVVMKE